jgi:uncharacterized PurR-regulated membrane protein YhhQ (DUF165 family)
MDLSGADAPPFDVAPMRYRAVGIISFLAFLASVPFANWWLTENGLWTSPLLGPIPSAIWVVAIAFVLRDLVQITLGRRPAWIAIAIGTVLSVWIAEPKFAVASGAAFAVSESLDALIFTPLASRGRFLLAVSISGWAAGFLDSAVFVRLAFGSFSGWWQLGVAKIVVIAAAAPVAWLVRRIVLRPHPDPSPVVALVTPAGGTIR